MKDEKKPTDKKVVGKIEPEKLPGREPEQLDHLKPIMIGIVLILAMAIIDAIAVKFFGFSGFLNDL